MQLIEKSKVISLCKNYKNGAIELDVEKQTYKIEKNSNLNFDQLLQDFNLCLIDNLLINNIITTVIVANR